MVILNLAAMQIPPPSPPPSPPSPPPSPPPAWTVVGMAGFSNGEASYVRLAFKPNTSLPYVAYQDSNNPDIPDGAPVRCMA